MWRGLTKASNENLYWHLKLWNKLDYHNLKAGCSNISEVKSERTTWIWFRSWFVNCNGLLNNDIGSTFFTNHDRVYHDSVYLSERVSGWVSIILFFFKIDCMHVRHVSVMPYICGNYMSVPGLLVCHDVYSFGAYISTEVKRIRKGNFDHLWIRVDKRMTHRLNYTTVLDRWFFGPWTIPLFVSN